MYRKILTFLFRNFFTIVNRKLHFRQCRLRFAGLAGFCYVLAPVRVRRFFQELPLFPRVYVVAWGCKKKRSCGGQRGVGGGLWEVGGGVRRGLWGKGGVLRGGGADNVRKLM